jgi:hypothetical protein
MLSIGHTVAAAVLVAVGLILAGSSLFNRATVEERPPIGTGTSLSVAPLATLPRGFTGMTPPEWGAPTSSSLSASRPAQKGARAK